VPRPWPWPARSAAWKRTASATPTAGNQGGDNDTAVDDTPNTPAGDAAAALADMMGGNYVPTELDGQVLGMLDLNCASCHQAPAALGNLDYVMDIDALITSGMVKVGDPDNSTLLLRMEQGNMPPAYITDQRPTAGDIAQVRTWIQGLGVAEECDPLDFMDVDEIWETIQADIISVDAEDQPFTRYMTATYASNGGVCGDVLDRQRYALFKGINSVSTEPSIGNPQPIDAQETIYRIDIRDYNWDREINVDLLGDGNVQNFADAWEAVLAGINVYAVEYEGDEADNVKNLTGTLVPMIPINAFTKFSQEEDLYYELIEGPQNINDLEVLLGIDEDDNFDRGRVWRAGFNTSGVSKQDRVLTRQEQSVGGLSYWLSFDFEDINGNESIFADPINFEFAGGEAIYSLPNGLQAYYVANAAGQRLNEAPASVVVDPSQNNGTVTNGASCHSCHQAGMIPFTDMVRPYVEANRFRFNAQDLEDVERIYPTKEEFDALAARDSEVHVSALERAGVPRGYADPLSRVYLSFELGDLDLELAAGELSIPADELLNEISSLDPSLGDLRVEDGHVDRDTFTDVYLDTICILQGSFQNRPANCQ
jgi:mono/diheme cytochrome c family protein